MEIIKSFLSSDEKYKVEVIHREDNLYQIESFRLESDDHPIYIGLSMCIKKSYVHRTIRQTSQCTFM